MIAAWHRSQHTLTMMELDFGFVLIVKGSNQQIHKRPKDHGSGITDTVVKRRGSSWKIGTDSGIHGGQAGVH
jgi:hypothetical protein